MSRRNLCADSGEIRRKESSGAVQQWFSVDEPCRKSRINDCVVVRLRAVLCRPQPASKIAQDHCALFAVPAWVRGVRLVCRRPLRSVLKLGSTDDLSEVLASTSSTGCPRHFSVRPKRRQATLQSLARSFSRHRGSPASSDSISEGNNARPEMSQRILEMIE